MLALKDELLAQPEEATSSPPEQTAILNADYTIFKIKSLSNHREVLEQPHDGREEYKLEDELEEGDTDQWTTVGSTKIPKYMLELQVVKPDMPIEFNKKVFYLIDLAL